MAVEGGGDYRQRLAQRQAAKKRRQQAGLRNTAANAGPPSSSKTFSTPAPKQDKDTFGKTYGGASNASLIGMGLDYFGNKILKPAIEKAQGDISEIPNIGESAEGTLFGALAAGSLFSPSGKGSFVKGLTSDRRIMQEAFEFTRDIAERAQREGQEALTPAERVIKKFQTRAFVRPSQEQLESLREALPTVSINPSGLNTLWKKDFLNAAQEAGEELPVFLSRGTRGVKLMAEDSPFDLNLVRHFLEAGKLGLRTPIEDIPKYDIGGMRIYRFNDPDMIKRANAVMRGEARGANKLYELLTDMPGRVGSPYQFSIGEAGNLRNALDETIGLPAPTVSAIWSSAGKLYPYVSRESAGTIGALEKMRSKTRPIIESAVEDRLGISDQGKAARQTILNFINSAENQTNVSQAFNALKSDMPFASLSGMSIPKDTPRTTVDLLRGILKKGSPLREVYEANTDLFNTTTEEAREILQKESPLNRLPNRTSDALIKSTKKIRNMAKRGVPEEDINAALREITDYIVMVGRLPKQKQPATSDIKKFLADIENRL